MIISLFDRAFKLMQRAPLTGSFVEFGVYKGRSLLKTIKMGKKYLKEKITFYGFDTFEGMPKTNKLLTGDLIRDYREGMFSDTGIEYVESQLKKERLQASLVKGRFDKLKNLSKYGVKKIRFVHIDADIYEGYRDALDKIIPYLQVGTVILMDEYCAPSDYRYQGIRFHGPKALNEWLEKTNINLHLIRFDWTCGLFVVVDEKYLRRYGSYIESLRNDNIAQSLTDLIAQLSFKIEKFL